MRKPQPKPLRKPPTDPRRNDLRGAGSVDEGETAARGANRQSQRGNRMPVFFGTDLVQPGGDTAQRLAYPRMLSQTLQLRDALDIDPRRSDFARRREPRMVATNADGDAVQRSDHRHRIDTHPRCDSPDTMPGTDRGIARLQHHGAEVQQHFQGISRWDGRCRPALLTS
jgi:hypothetical protein